MSDTRIRTFCATFMQARGSSSASKERRAQRNMRNDEVLIYMHDVHWLNLPFSARTHPVGRHESDAKYRSMLEGRPCRTEIAVGYGAVYVLTVYLCKSLYTITYAMT